jgi:TRAP-type C4-dicarboxylate transport system permease small subunit
VKLGQFGHQGKKWLHGITAANKWLSIITFIIMACITTGDVVGRYLLHRPVLGAFELVQTLMMVLVYSIFAYVAEVDFNIRVDVIYVKLPKRAQAILDVISSFGSIIVMSIITWQIAFRATLSFQRIIPDLVSALVPWSLWPFETLAAIGSAVLVIQLIVWFVRSIGAAINPEGVSLEPEEKAAKPDTIL